MVRQQHIRSPAESDRVQVSRNLVQSELIAGHRGRYSAIRDAFAECIHQAVVGDRHVNAAEAAYEVPVHRTGNPDLEAAQIGKSADRLVAEDNLRRIGPNRQQFQPISRPIDFPQNRKVGVDAGPQ